jgi:dipeptidase E
MKLLLTASGLRNESLTGALRDLLDKPFGSANAVFIPTASLAVPGDHSWLLGDLNRLHALGWNELNILTFDGLPRDRVLARLRHADVIYVEGGNHYQLADRIMANGLAEEFLDLLRTKVYVGVSAGSMIFSRRFGAHAAELIGELDDLAILDGRPAAPPFGLFDWYLKPHLNSPDFPARDEAWAQRIGAAVDFPLYLLDDQSALRVLDGQVEVVGEGDWRYFDGTGTGTGTGAAAVHG